MITGKFEGRLWSGKGMNGEKSWEDILGLNRKTGLGLVGVILFEGTLVSFYGPILPRSFFLHGTQSWCTE